MKLNSIFQSFILVINDNVSLTTNQIMFLFLLARTSDTLITSFNSLNTAQKKWVKLFFCQGKKQLFAPKMNFILLILQIANIAGAGKLYFFVCFNAPSPAWASSRKNLQKIININLSLQLNEFKVLTFSVLQFIFQDFRFLYSKLQKKKIQLWISFSFKFNLQLTAN